MRMKGTRYGALLCLALIPNSCSLYEATRDALILSSDEKRERQLESVAKDWCQTIRASQVIPVYPLTRDLEPGDMFLVTNTVDKQDEVYQRRGFLDLERHVARLTTTPGRERDAFFPSYSFEVSEGSGVQLAIPVHAVPVGLGLLSTDEAVGSVVLSEASTYGVPLVDLLQPVTGWAEQPENRQLLQAMVAGKGKKKDKKAWLRVVNRIYLIGGLDVSLSHAGTVSTGAQAGGASNPLTLLERAAADGPAAYTAALQALNDSLSFSGGGGPPPTDGHPPQGDPDDGNPGDERDPGDGAAVGSGSSRTGSIRITQATRRTVTASETFAEPLVVGYMAFDFPIHPGGQLGYPTTTMSVLEGSSTGETGSRLGVFTEAQDLVNSEKSRIAQIAGRDPEKAIEIYRMAAESLDGLILAGFNEALQAAGPSPDFEDVRDAFSHASTQARLGSSSPRLVQSAIGAVLQEARLAVVHGKGR